MTTATLLMVCASVAAAGALLDLAAAWRGRPPRPVGRPAVSARWAIRRGGDERTERLLDGAGRAQGVPTGAALRAREDAAAALGAAWGGALAVVIGGPVLAIVVAPLAGWGGRRLPRVALTGAAARRAERLRDEAPEVAALLAGASSCGLPLAAMLDVAGSWLCGDLPAGIRAAGQDLRRGAAVDQVLGRLAREHPIDEVVTIVAILQRSRDHGVPAGPALSALAATARAARARRASDRAAKAAPRIQLVSALLLVPAALCMLGAAMLAGGLH